MLGSGGVSVKSLSHRPYPVPESIRLCEDSPSSS